MGPDLTPDEPNGQDAGRSTGHAMDSIERQLLP
jgi:hypothetical protein